MSTNTPVLNPTWYGNIRDMFTEIDIQHMGNQGLDLTDYDTVKDQASSIYSYVKSGAMPPGAPWPADQVQTFNNWMTTGYPKGVPAKIVSTAAALAGSVASRVRKSITSLSPNEVSVLTTAFNGIMQLSPTDLNSYFNLAGYHGNPGYFCSHHVPKFLPWHRAHLLAFENALRTIPGCANVTLPYWDFSELTKSPAELPAILNQAPFASYTVPSSAPTSPNIGGFVTSRYTAAQIATNFTDYSVLADLDRAAQQTSFEAYNGYIDRKPNNTAIAAHDGGHVSIGSTMANQSIAAFDPIFWFYHCNLDRLYWEWQQNMHATTLNGLLTTIVSAQSRKVFTDPPSEAMPPFSVSPYNWTTVNTVDSIGSLDVAYTTPGSQVATTMVTGTDGNVKASRKFSVVDNVVNVRVKGINRLKIPGSFKVHLMKDDKVIASRAFFQPDDADKCPNCVDNAMVHFDFNLPIGDASGGQLGVWVEPLDHSKFGDHFPNKLMGNPTVNARLLLSTE
ncbi:tyrosinase family protein [Undibacterium sp. Ji50W]|uniref:tyrosinase family protein n=1 Tax=Undibacterium sp. Ji50W TaxID=3413041 RepID=UPI003BF1ED79